MEASSLCTFLAPILLLLLLTLKLFSSWLRQPRNLPPSPPSIPILGHLHLIKLPLHRTFHSLSLSYGPVLSLRLGSRRVVVVSSVEAAKECYTKNDVALANRPSNVTSKHLGYNSADVVSAPYGDHWCNLRRICNLEIFSSVRLNSFFPIRRDEIERLLLNLNKRPSSSHDNFTKVELNSMFLEMTFNIIVRIVTGKRYYGEDVTNTEEATSFREMMSQILKYVDGVCPGDFLSILRLAFRDYEKNVSRLGNRSDQFLQNLIEEHRGSPKKGGKESGDAMVDHLLSLQETQPAFYTDEIIKGLMQVLLIAGSAATLPREPWKGQQRLIDETDIAKVSYRQNIIIETLSLEPPAPLLFLHMSSENCTIGGYNVPRQTRVFINAWTIHTDPKSWDDPPIFKPEIFENVGDGQCKFLPIGVGRLACPRANMAQRMINLAFGSLIQCFECTSVSEEGANMPKVVPLEALCKAREMRGEDC